MKYRRRAGLSVAAFAPLLLLEMQRPSLADLPSTGKFIDIVTTCAIGMNLSISGDLEGSIKTIYEGEKTQGQLTANFATRFLELFPDPDKFKAYQVYVTCVKDQVGNIASPGPSVKTFSFETIIDGKDGNGNVVAKISGVSVTISDTGASKNTFTINYAYYNGSGTWRGDQTLSIFFLHDNANLKTINVPIDRGHCTYGGGEPRTFTGEMENILAVVTGISASVDAVRGPHQSPC